MSAFLPALLVTVFFVALVGGICTIGSGQLKKALWVNGVMALVLFLLNWLGFYLTRPVLGFSLTSFYKSWWLIMIETAIIIAVNIVFVGVSSLSSMFGGRGYSRYGNDDSGWFSGISKGSIVMVVAWVLIFAYGILNMMNGIWTDGRSKELANQVTVKMADVGDYPDTDTNHIVVVPEQVARKSAGTAMSSGDNNLSTRYELLDPVLQSVDGHAYWILPMRPSGFLNSNKVGGKVPGYAVVDAEDPSTPASIRTTDASDKKFDLNYSLNGAFSHNLQRYVWSHGYTGTPVEDWTLEVDDQWKPYWTASTNRLTLNFKQTVPNGLLTVDAQTGEIQHYQLSKMPTWVDRIYSAGVAKQLMNWWGNYANSGYGFFGMFRGKADRYKVHGEPTLVYTNEGYPDWQVELTSYNSDSSVSYMALFDGRTSSARLYRIPDVAIEEAVADAIKGSSSNLRKLCPTHLAMHKIYGQLTWVAPLVPDGQCGSDDTAIMQGVALAPADEQLNGGNIVIGQTMSEALNDYRTLLNGNASVKPGEDADVQVVTGVIENVSAPLNEGGKTVYYFLLAEDTHVYRVGVDPNAETANLEVPFIHVGAKVTISFLDSASIRRDVQSYDDFDLHVGS